MLYFVVYLQAKRTCFHFYDSSFFFDFDFDYEDNFLLLVYPLLVS